MRQAGDDRGPSVPNAETISGLRALAEAAARTSHVDAAAAHPDAELLGLCANVFDRHAAIEAVWREWREVVAERRNGAHPAALALVARVRELTNASRTPMTRIGKLPATTAAGVHAKALVLRRSRGNAPKLAASLADDVLALRGLRAGDVMEAPAAAAAKGPGQE